MYLLGGIDNSTTYMNDVWSSSDGKTWTQITDNATWPKGYGHLATAFSKKIWVIGGGNGSSVFSKVYSSSDGKTWTDAGASGDWSARNNHAAIAFVGKLSVM